MRAIALSIRHHAEVSSVGTVRKEVTLLLEHPNRQIAVMDGRIFVVVAVIRHERHFRPLPNRVCFLLIQRPRAFG